MHELESKPSSRKARALDLPSGLAREAQTLSRQLELIELWEEVGLASKALRIMEHECGPELRASAEDRLSLVTELHRLYRSYCRLLYAGLLPPLSTFAEWVGCDKGEQMAKVARQWAEASCALSLIEVFAEFLRPIFTHHSSEKQEMLLSYLSSSGYRVTPSTEESWEERFVSSLSLVLRKGYLSKFEEVASLAEASLPTLPREQRCIDDVGLLVRLVTEACLAFDDLDRGLPAMWRLVVTTPEAVIPGMEADFRALDKIQAALAAAEVLRAYFPPPPLSILIVDHRRDRLLQAELTKSLVKGLGYLDVDLSELRRLGLSFLREPPHIEARTPSLHQALVIKMCGSFAQTGTVGVGDIAQLATDLLELRRGLLAGLPAQWVGAVAFNGILHHCPMELTYAITDDMLRPERADDDDSERSSLRPLFQSLGVDAELIECLLVNRATGIFDAAASCHDSGTTIRLISFASDGH